MSVIAFYCAGVLYARTCQLQRYIVMLLTAVGCSLVYSNFFATTGRSFPAVMLCIVGSDLYGDICEERV